MAKERRNKKCGNQNGIKVIQNQKRLNRGYGLYPFSYANERYFIHKSKVSWWFLEERIGDINRQKKKTKSFRRRKIQQMWYFDEDCRVCKQ